MLPRFAKDDEPIVGPKLGSSHVAGDHTFAIADNSHDGRHRERIVLVAASERECG